MQATHTLFVYGTLKHGGKWHHLLANSKLITPDSVKGEMYLHKDLYPVLFTGEDDISGETYLVPEGDYDKAVALESDALYNVALIETASGHKAEVFFSTDESTRDPAHRIAHFDAEFYFKKWLEMASPSSESYQSFLEWGGRPEIR